MHKIDPRNFHRATRTTAKDINRQIVLNLVREYEPISRADLARRMEVARGILTPLVNELIEGGLIHERATGAAARGRKPVLLHVRTHDRLAVGVDVRFSQTQVMLADFSGRALATEVLRTPATPEELLGELSMRVRRLLGSHAERGECHGVGVVVPGTVDDRTGRLLNAPALGWRNVDLREALSCALELPVYVERDAVACAQAQVWLGKRSGDGVDSLAYVTVSDGVGAGLVLGGRVVRGHCGAAGEVGHLPLAMDGPACVCGARGCLEAYASNVATVARYLGRELATRESYAVVRDSGVTIETVIARAHGGDAAAREALEVSARYIGVGLGSIVNTLNPERIVIGGEIVAAWDIVAPHVIRAMTERTQIEGTCRTPVVPESPGEQTRLRGAAALVVAPVFAAPSVG